MKIAIIILTALAIITKGHITLTYEWGEKVIDINWFALIALVLEIINLIIK